MRIILGADTPAPAWPEGIACPAFDPERHLVPARTLLNRAYAQGEGDVLAPGDWWESISTDEEFDPALCLVAWDTRRDMIAGFAQCWTSGFVKDIATAPAWRHTGLGRALMAQVFAIFRVRGKPQVALKVRAGNTGARAFYRALGMEEVSG